ncbi:transcription termination/antitermination protein NusA [Candidatus Saccharibacteria bacterium]|nr:transcription termination/antitermination protein NusA [Candidatus Saccharibacteria bacterium]NIV04275.1 transcription termination/antitermination protein NusA [Calditrichia bacterium]
MKQICEEKGISYESVLETIEAALGAAYRKDFGNKLQNIKVNFDPDTAGIRVFDVKEVVEDIDLEELDNKAEEEAEAKEEEKGEKKEEKSAEGGSQSKADAPREHASGGKEGKKEEKDEEPDEEAVKFNPKTQIMISDAKDIKKSAKVGDEIKVELEVPGAFGRMAAQTAKQVITQKLREAERETIFDEYKDNVDEIINAVVQRREGKIVLIDLGRATGIIRPEDQVPGEYYRPGERIKVYVVKVEMTTKGPEILLSRSHPEMVRRLFELEIPEIAGGTVEIKAISREAGSRSKVAVTTSEENVDPIGSCIGQRGTRIQTIIAELGGEKIDIIEWSEDAETFIMNALSPAKVTKVELNEAEKSALATVASDQLSLAIGKGGQNVRLAAKLTGWKINVAEEGGDVVADSEQGELKKEEVETEEIKEEKEEAKEEVKSASGGEEKEEKEVKKEKETKKEEEKEEKKEKKTKAKKSAEGGSASGGEEDKK